MFELMEGRRLARALAVLLGIVLLWPAAPRVSSQTQQSGLSSADEHPRPNGKLEQSDDVPSESSEGEGSEFEDGSLDQVAFLPPLRESGNTATRIAMLEHALPRLKAGCDGVPRSRGPPLG
jgi:hypothetical protein